MPRKQGSYTIFSASEVGEYVLCPESWRLKYLVKKSKTPEESEVTKTQSLLKEQGNIVHEKWGESIDLKVELMNAFRLAFTIFISALVLLLLSRVLKSPEARDYINQKRKSFTRGVNE